MPFANGSLLIIVSRCYQKVNVPSDERCFAFNSRFNNYNNNYRNNNNRITIVYKILITATTVIKNNTRNGIKVSNTAKYHTQSNARQLFIGRLLRFLRQLLIFPFFGRISNRIVSGKGSTRITVVIVWKWSPPKSFRTTKIYVRSLLSERKFTIQQ